MGKPVAYFKDSTRRQHFVMEMLSPWGLHYHLVFNMLSHILPSIVQLSSLKKADNPLNKKNQKKKKERTKKRKMIEIITESVSWRPLHLGERT